jgi:folate-binding protein YgfZ
MRGYDAIEKTSALLDRSGEGRIRVTGADRVAWLQGLLTNDIAALAPGTGCYAAYLTPQGRMITDVRVLEASGFAGWNAGAPDTTVSDWAASDGAASDGTPSLLLDLPGSRKDDVLQRLEMFIITEDVTVEDVTASLARIGLHGRGVWQTILATVQLPLVATPGEPMVGHDNPLPEHANIAGTFRGHPILVAGSRELGVPGVDLYIAAEAAPDLRASLLAAGAEEMDEEAWQARRIEVGRPLFGVDMTTDTIQLEAGIEDRAISFTKGCYVGQEIIIRVTHRGGGRVARKLVGIAPPALSTPVTPGTLPAWRPEAGAAIFSGDRQIGHLTSVAFSPRLGHCIAMGYVQRDFVNPGTAVQIAAPAATATPASVSPDAAGDAPVLRLDAIISELPFVADPAAL